TSGKTLTAFKLNNRGTIEARNGSTFAVSDPTNLANLSNNTLTGGRWNVFANSTLSIPNITITTNSADVTLSGPNSRFDALNAITQNTAHLALLADRDFTTSSSL